MNTRAAEKVADALALFLEGYLELQGKLREEILGVVPVADDEEEEDTDDLSDEEVDAAMVTEMKAAIETALESEDYAPSILGSALAVMTEALEEIDPTLFEDDEEEEEEEEEVDDEEYEDIDDDDLDDEDYEDDEDEEEEDEEDDD